MLDEFCVLGTKLCGSVDVLHVLYGCAVYWCSVLVGLVHDLSKFVSKTREAFITITRHLEVHLAVDLVPVEGYPTIFVSFSVFFYDIEFLEYTNEMVCMLLAYVLHAKIINY